MASRQEDVLLKIKADAKEVDIALGKLKDNFKDFGKDAESQALALQKRINGILKGVGVGLGVAATAIGSGLAASAYQAAEFEQSMRNVNTIAQLNEKSFASLTDQVVALNRTAGLAEGPRSLAAALYSINSAGYKGQDGINVLEASSRAATAGLTDTKTAADGLTTALNAYGKTSADAAEVADVLFKTVEEGKITFPTLSSNLGKVAAVAHAGNVDIYEAGAAIAQLTAKGLSAEEAVIALRGAILKMLAPTKAQVDVAKQYGIELGEAELKAKGFAGKLAEIAEKTGGSKQALFKIIGEVRAFNGALKLVGNDGGKTFIDRIDRFRTTAPQSLERAFAQQKKALLTQLAILKGQVESAAISIGNALLPIGKGAVKGLTDAVSGFNALSETSKKVSAWSVVVVGASAAAAAGIISVKLAADAATIALARLADVGAGTAIGKLATKLAPIAEFFAGISFSTFAAGAVLVGVSLVAINNNAEQLSKTIDHFKSQIDSTFGGAAEKAADFSKSTGVSLSVLSDNFKEVSAFVLTVLDVLSNTLLTIFGGALVAAFRSIVGLLSDAGGAISETVATIYSLLTGDLDAAEKHALKALENLGAAIKDVFSPIADYLNDVYDAIIHSADSLDKWREKLGLIPPIADDVSAGVNDIIDYTSKLSFVSRDTFELMKSQLEDIKGTFGGLQDAMTTPFDELKSTVESVFNYISSLFGGLKEQFTAVSDSMVQSLSPIKNLIGGAFESVKRISGNINASASNGPAGIVDPLQLAQDNKERTAQEEEVHKILELERKKLQVDVEKGLKTRVEAEQKLLEIAIEKEAALKDQLDIQNRLEKAKNAEKKQADKQAVKEQNLEAKTVMLDGFKVQMQSTSISCGQATIADAANFITGSNLTDKQFASQYGYQLQGGLEALTGIKFKDTNLKDVKIEDIAKATQAGIPVPVGVGYPYSSRPGVGHKFNIVGTSGNDTVRYADPADGQFKQTTLTALKNSIPDYQGNFALLPQGIEKRAELFKAQISQATDNAKEMGKQMSELDKQAQDIAAQRFDGFLDFANVDFSPTADEINQIVDEAQKLPGLFPGQEIAQSAAQFSQEIKSNFDELINYYKLQEAAGVKTQQQILQATKDAAAQTLQTEGVMTQEKLALLATYKDAVTKDMQDQLAQLKTQKQLGLASAEEFKQRREDIVREAGQQLTNLGINAYETMQMLQQFAEENSIQIKDLAGSVAENLGNNFQTFLNGVLTGQTKFSNAFKSLWASLAQEVVQSLIKMIAKTQVYIAVMKVLSLVMNSVFGVFGALFGIGAKVISGFASPDIVSIPTAVTNLGIAHNGATFGPEHLRGTANLNPLPDEMLALLRRDETVLDPQTTNDLLSGRSRAFGRGGNAVVIENQNFYSPNSNEISQEIGRGLEYELAGRIGGF